MEKRIILANKILRKLNSDHTKIYFDHPIEKEHLIASSSPSHLMALPAEGYAEGPKH